MNIIEATYDDADLVGEVHSLAWKQAYKDIFPTEYIMADTTEKRKQEFLESFRKESCKYYLVYENGCCAGVVKAILDNSVCEISSIYFLNEFRNKGLGTETITQLKEIYKDYRIVLWTLEMNTAARNFYEKNGFVITANTRNINRGKAFVQVQYEFKK